MAAKSLIIASRFFCLDEKLAPVFMFIFSVEKFSAVI